jgi:hypothetical protein
MLEAARILAKLNSSDVLDRMPAGMRSPKRKANPIISQKLVKSAWGLFRMFRVLINYYK